MIVSLPQLGPRSSTITPISIYLGIVIVMSVVCFAAYGLDKRQATNGGRRVQERTLHTLAFLGGWPGALLGQRQFRHKTKKLPFLIAFWLIVVLHVSIVGAAAYAYFGPFKLGAKTHRPVAEPILEEITAKKKCFGHYRSGYCEEGRFNGDSIPHAAMNEALRRAARREPDVETSDSRERIHVGLTPRRSPQS